MKPRSNIFLWGVFLVCLGALSLLNSFDVIRFDEEVGPAMLFFSAGIVLIVGHFFFSKKLWSLIVGGICMFIGVATYIDATGFIRDEYIGIALFVLTGLIFLSALRQGRKNWWAIIPGGYSLSIAAHIALDLSWHGSGLWHSVVVFGGTGLIFGAIFLLKNETYNLDWAKYPSIIAFAICALTLFAADFEDVVSRFFFPVLLIGLGALLLFRSTRTLQESDDKPAGKAGKKKEG
ncbi:hypothetical protein JXO52_02320 [bacterium]|nr:hypothetical protein [bacterium]